MGTCVLSWLRDVIATGPGASGHDWKMQNAYLEEQISVDPEIRRTQTCIRTLDCLQKLLGKLG